MPSNDKTSKGVVRTPYLEDEELPVARVWSHGLIFEIILPDIHFHL